MFHRLKSIFQSEDGPKSDLADEDFVTVPKIPSLSEQLNVHSDPTERKQSTYIPPTYSESTAVDDSQPDRSPLSSSGSSSPKLGFENLKPSSPLLQSGFKNLSPSPSVASVVSGHEERNPTNKGSRDISNIAYILLFLSSFSVVAVLVILIIIYRKKIQKYLNKIF